MEGILSTPVSTTGVLWSYYAVDFLHRGRHRNVCAKYIPLPIHLLHGLTRKQKLKMKIMVGH